MKLQWFKLLLTSLKKVKKRVWVVFSLIIGLIIGWNTVLSEYKRLSVQATLGSNEAKIRLGDLSLRLGGRQCVLEDRWLSYDLQSALDYYFSAISSKEAQSRVLALFECPYTSDKDKRAWRAKITDYISHKFKHITEIENWITDKRSLEAVIRFYFYETYSHDYSYLGEALINRKIDECEGEGRLSCLSKLAAIVTRLKDIPHNSDKWQSVALNLYELLLKEDLDNDKKDYYQFRKAMTLLPTLRTSDQGLVILNELTERDFVPALVILGRGNLLGNLFFERNLELGKKRLLRALKVCPSKCNRETNYSLFERLAFNSVFNEEREDDDF